MNEEGVSSKDVYYEGCLDGQMAERAAVVAWLRDEETWRRVARGNLADFIERGEHLKDEQ